MSNLPHWAPRTLVPGAGQPANGGEVLSTQRRHRHRGPLPLLAVASAELINTKGGQLIDIEGDPQVRQPGHPLPKGADAFQLAVNPHRVTQVLYRAPYSDHWETRSLDWALDQIARRSRRCGTDFTVQNEAGRPLNSVHTIGTLGGATIDNEENYLSRSCSAADWA